LYRRLGGPQSWSGRSGEEKNSQPLPEHGLRVFENRVQGIIFGPKREEVAGGWRRLHNEELHNLHASPNIIRVIKSSRMRWSGHVARMGEVKNTHKILVGMPEGKRPLGNELSDSIKGVKYLE
jgi:hypothetical protein